MLRRVAIWCLLAAAVLCAWGAVENTWMANFDTPYGAVYAKRAEAFFFVLLGTLLAALVLSWEWRRGALVPVSEARLRTTGFCCSLAAAMVCGWGCAGNLWAAGFDSRYRRVYAERADVFAILLLASIAMAAALLWKWVRRRLAAHP